VNVLAIETSCDETAAAVVRDGRHVLSSVVRSQVAEHSPYGGVVPEIASRSHVESLPAVIDKAVADAGVGYDGVDAVAVTYGPGLASSLLVGVSAAKALSMRLDKPLYAVNHLEAHIYSVFMEEDAPGIDEVVPFLALVVSGGHTCLVRVEGLGHYSLLGQTIDDAAGEAFDKGANLLGLGYPGGPVIDKTAREGDAKFVRFPRGRVRAVPFEGIDAGHCFSFSGLKTALLYYLRDHPLSEGRSEVPSLAASYQEAILDALVDRCAKALTDETHIASGGGVSLNSRLRQKLAALADERGVGLLLAKPKYCGDNAAMIAGLAGAGQGIGGEAAMSIDVEPNLRVVTHRPGAV